MISKDLFTKRQVHLDFHTSPDIKGIGKSFSKKDFQDALRLGKVESVTVFAKCHHGLCYYPTKVGTVHPHLSFDLTGEMVDAAHKIGVRAPIYITAGWSDLDARTHPEWISRNRDGSEITSPNFEKLSSPDEPKAHCAWQTLCMNDGGGYAEHIYALTEEVCRRYKCIDGLFYDICIVNDVCYCDSCVRGMRAMGLDPDKVEDAKAYFIEKRGDFMKKCAEIMKKYHPSATIFFNSGGANQYKKAYHRLQTHFEMEDLPTAWGGYNKLPMRAKFFEQYDKPTLAMTGKFHLDWGEFGGFKPKEALKYEISLMALYGVGASIGDHLHPDGEPEEETYRNIGYAYEYLDRIAPFCYGGHGVANLGVYPTDKVSSNEGISTILSENQIDFDVISAENFGKYSTVIISDGARLDKEETKHLKEYLSKGGKLMLMGDLGGFDKELLYDLGLEYLSASEYDCDYLLPATKTDEVPNAPMLCNIPSHRVKLLKECRVIAEAIDPYFSRTAAHFCGHKNTPHNKSSERRPAIAKIGNVVYTAHPLASQYYEFGSVYHKRYFLAALNSIYEGSNIKVTGLLSEGRCRMIKQEAENRYCINLAYASPSRRGSAEIIDDIIPIYDLNLKVNVPERIKRVYLPLKNKELAFEAEDGEVEFLLPKLLCHETIVLEY